MDNKIKQTIDKIVLLAQQDMVFATELRKVLQIAPSAIPVYNESVEKDIKFIREALEIRANPSINYDFIENDYVREQLIVDNLRMENYYVSFKYEEVDRFFNFCFSAFLQIENLLTFYFEKTFEKNSNKDKIIRECINYWISKEKYNNHVSEDSHVFMIHKINAYYNMFCEKNMLDKMNVHNLRAVRNEVVHRDSTISKDEKSEISNLYYYSGFDGVRKIVQNLAESVKKNIGKYKLDVKICDFFDDYVILNFMSQVFVVRGNLYAKIKQQEFTKESLISVLVCNQNIIDIL